ncbi:hypothetical protein NLU13_9162 [Sarocladium strictum]|uniref:DUF6536 domain-containing protein n=1 Tax=Sarocladium strictum TaxID=5046 RepID=A0AA39GA76_SARSR|nr:hypothetical protein NLU13_9162 [Sarocladium strictum]
MTGGSARSAHRSKQPPAAVQEGAVHAQNQGFVHAVRRDDDDEIEFIPLDELTNEEQPTDSTDQAVECPDPGRQQSRDRVEQAEASQSISQSAGRSNASNGDDNIIAVRGFARRAHLGGWLPRVLDTESTSQRIWWSRRSRALMVQISIIGVILFLNLGLTIFAVSSYGSSNGVGLVYEGKCSTVRALDLWLHLLINLLSTGLLSASNYCMQLQAAPMRRDVDAAHKDGKWLDIGIPSLRNLVYINWWRRVSWALLAFSSVPVHLIYNSAVFQSLSSHSYTVGVVKDSFTNGASWDLANAEDRRFGDPGWYDTEGLDRVNPKHWNYTSRILDLQTSASTYTRLNVSACFDLYNDYWVPQGNALLFVRNESVQTPANDSLLIYVGVVPRSDDWAKNMWALGNGTREFKARPPDSPVKTWFVGSPKYEVSHCLVQPPERLRSECRFEYSPYIMFTVCLMNMIKAVIMLLIWVLRRRQEKQGDPGRQILYTLGDAISSFMREPDRHTRELCLATKDDFRTHRNWKFKEIPLKDVKGYTGGHPRAMTETSYRWRKAASPRRWFILLAACITVLLIVGILLLLGSISLRHRSWDTDMRGLLRFGFGALTPDTFLVLNLPRGDPEGLISNVLIANLPQLVLSVLYILYNTMLSTFLVQREFSRMHLDRYRKPLRVSEPQGIQRSSYFISLPLRYGVPLYASSGVMHWLVSRSFFLARITAMDPDNEQNEDDSFSTCAYSPFAIFVTMVVGIVLVGVIVGIGFRKYEGIMRMVSTNSKAISAACHVLTQDKKEGYLLPVQWGVVSRQNGVGHCAFTTARTNSIKPPKKGMRYS